MLLERETQFASLNEYAEEARSGDGRLVLVSGEVGIGKSSLLEELQVDLRDASWLWGACDGLFTPRPLAPLRDIAREIAAHGDTGIGDLLDGELPRERVFDEVLAWLTQRHRLTVIVVEDVHWADDATLDLLRYLGRRLRRLPVLLLVTFRDDALPATDPLRVALGELGTQRSTRRIDLPPLSMDGVRRLASGGPHRPEELLQLTGGNPFFLVEVLGHEGTDVPGSVRDAVLARAATVGGSTRTTLEVAALAALRVDTQLVSSAANATPEDFDALVAAGPAHRGRRDAALPAWALAPRGRIDDPGPSSGGRAPSTARHARGRLRRRCPAGPPRGGCRRRCHGAPARTRRCPSSGGARRPSGGSCSV
ncbi:MAG: AAA family ATPase [Nocardioides sp.]|uniref:AAA family ATPase n=1 Tax=Nocardioides sp. TaxID=35761 RepID=UPI0039E3B84B